MEEKRCNFCMKLKTEKVCPHCGYDEDTPGALHHLPAGVVLNNQYLIGRVLGQGGFGITYLGWDQNLDTPIAVKEYFPNGYVQRNHTRSLDVVANKDMEPQFQNGKAYFLREAKILAKLSDVPEVVHVRNYFQANGTAYIVMEYIQGITLSKYIHKRGEALNLQQALGILKPIMAAMAEVHDAELIHRDISPNNIMLYNNRVKLLDFGAARNVDHADASKALPKSTQAMVKHGFAPIEQYQSRGALGPWTDIYAMGATLYYCLSGKAPTAAPDRLSADTQLDWHSVSGELTSNQIAVLNQAMALRPKDRVKDMRTLMERLYSEKTPELDFSQDLEAKEEEDQAIPVKKKSADAQYPKTVVDSKAPVSKSGNMGSQSVSGQEKGAGAVSKEKYPATVVETGGNNTYPETVIESAGNKGYPETVVASGEEKSYPKTAPVSTKTNNYPKTTPASEGNRRYSASDSGSRKNKEKKTTTRKRPGRMLGIVLILIVLLAAAAFAVKEWRYQNYHIWTEPSCEEGSVCTICGKAGDRTALGHDYTEQTCTDASVCRNCGVVQAEATGHQWVEATCTSPKTCRICQTTEGKIPGHDWLEATETTPMTCKRCGETSGNVKGYIGTIGGTWEPFYSAGYSAYCYVLNTPILNCKTYTMNLSITNVTHGKVEGRWEAFYRDANDNWVSLGYFELKEDKVSVTYTFDSPKDITAVTAVIHGGRSSNFSKAITVTDVIVYED